MTETAHSLLVIVIVGVAVVAIGLLVAIIVYAKRRSDAEREKFGRVLRASGLVLPDSNEVRQHKHEDIDFTVRFVVERNKPHHLEFTIRHANRGHLAIRRETVGDRMFKRLGIVVETQTRDRTFDDAYFIESGEPVFARALLSRDESRRAVRTIMACGFSRIELDNDTIRATLEKPKTAAKPGRGILDAIAAMHELGIEQPKIPEHLGRDQRLAWLLRVRMIYALFAVLAAAAFGGFLYGHRQFTPLDGASVFGASLVYSLPSIVVLLFVVILVLKGYSTSHRHLTITTAVMIPTLLMLGFAGLESLNAIDDQSPLSMHEAAVVDKRISGGRSKSYLIYVPSWRYRNASEKLNVPRQLFHELTPQQSRIAIGTRAGRFGYEWIAVAPRKVAGTADAVALPAAPAGLQRYE